MADHPRRVDLAVGLGDDRAVARIYVVLGSAGAGSERSADLASGVPAACARRQRS